MTSSPGLYAWSRLQSNYSLPWGVTDDYRRQRQTTTDTRKRNNTGPLHCV